MCVMYVFIVNSIQILNIGLHIKYLVNCVYATLFVLASEEISDARSIREENTRKHKEKQSVLAQIQRQSEM